MRSITVNKNDVLLNGTSAIVAAALDGITGYKGNVITTDDHTLPELKTINNATDGTINLHNVSVPLTGTVADLKDALDGISYKGAITISNNANDAVAATDITTIANATTATPVIANQIVIEGLASAVDTTFSKVTNTGNAKVTITDTSGTSLNATLLSGISSQTTGEVTVSNAITVQGDTSQVTAAFVTSGTNVKASTANINISDTSTVSQFAAIDRETNGTIQYALSDSISQIDSATSSQLSGTRAITATDTLASGSTDLDNVKVLLTSQPQVFLEIPELTLLNFLMSCLNQVK